MAGNKHDNGVHEQGTDETRMAYQEDTPGQSVEQYIEDRNKAYHEEAVEKKKKHFSQVFQNPLKGFPYNEEIQVDKISENYNQDLTLATKNVARLSKKETGQDQKDYQAVSKALAQGNLGAVKKVIKGISTKEIQADLLNILVGYNDLIAKMYPKAIDSKGNLKKGLNVDKLIKEDNIEEGFAERQREKTKSQQKAHQKRMIKIARKSIKDYEKKNKKEEIDENADASLKKKSEKSGISVGILKQVYNRGVAAWKTGHRPGTTPEQWGHARVNSFITKGSGTWGKADKDLAKKAGG
jgi:hypothetical protein